MEFFLECLQIADDCDSGSTLHELAGCEDGPGYLKTIFNVLRELEIQLTAEPPEDDSDEDGEYPVGSQHHALETLIVNWAVLFEANWHLFDEDDAYDAWADGQHNLCNVALKHCEQLFLDLGVDRRQLGICWWNAEVRQRNHIRAYCEKLIEQKKPIRHDYFCVITWGVDRLRHMMDYADFEATSVDGPIQDYMSVFERESLYRAERNKQLLEQILEKIS